MLKKRLGTEAIERSWDYDCVDDYFKIPSTLTILESCEKIGPGALWGSKELKEVVILNGCKNIGEFAFKDCYNLEKVEIPESVEWIEEGAFCCCKKAEIILKKAICEFRIDKNAFYYCKSIEDVEKETRN